MELGRAISDAPYGIRGMANNLSQLTSLMYSSAAAAGGFRLALKQMWTAMMGPLGIVLAIQGVLALLDGFAGGMKKAAKEVKGLTDGISSLASKLKDLSLTEEQQAMRIEEYIKFLSKLRAKLDSKKAKDDERRTLK